MLTLSFLSVLAVASPAPAKHRVPSTGLRAIAFGKAPPDFRFDSGQGPQRLNDLTGKPVVINFWASWCEPCREELPVLSEVRQTYGNAVALITLSDEAPGVARAFLSGRGLSLPLVEDPNRSIFDAYSIDKVPVTLVLDRTGSVSHVSVGQLDWTELHAAIEQALGSSAGAST